MADRPRPLIPISALLHDPGFIPECYLDAVDDSGFVDVPQVGLARYRRRGLPPDVALWCSSLHSGDFTGQDRISVQRMVTGIAGLWFQILDQDRSSRRGRLVVSGPQERSAVLPMAGVFHSVTLTFRPGAFRALFGIPAVELSNSRVDLDDLLPGEGRSLLQQLIDLPGAAEQYDALVEWVRGRIRRHARATDQEMVTSIQRWIASSGHLRDLSHCTGESQRQLQRCFSERVGMTPTAFSRIWQVRRVLNVALGRVDPQWADLAYSHGFVDQSHLNRRWKEVMGDSPARFHRRWRGGGIWVDGLVFLPTEDSSDGRATDPSKSSG